MGIIDNSRIKIEIDGVEFTAKRGAKIIEIADEAGIYIPRFCYHKKLSIAANCRMCLVEVEKAPKLFPACATPVTDGMKIFTNTDKVVAAQRAIMEFLLVNHPLDCPICDQGGECELQDLTVGYGCSSSRFVEDKRSFDDYDFGPLVATDVTRCILCSRCVRFCSEISGTDDLGIVNRGSNSRIFTFLKNHLKSGLSGNVIDLCPVGSLTAKPSRFKFRPWELVQKFFVSYHDCVGSNLYLHVSKDKVVRVVPKRNEFLNENWISDRDRFSYEGLYSEDRLNSPIFKDNGVWKNISWDHAFKIIFEKLNNVINEFGSDQIAAFASPNSTCEEFYILQKFLRKLGSNNLDHRLNQIDFRDQDKMPIFTGMDIGIDELENIDSVLVIGSDLIKDHPILGIKLRKIINKGGYVCVLNPIDFDFLMPISDKIVVNPKEFIPVILSLIKNITNFLNINDSNLENLFSNLINSDKYSNIANKFLNSKKKLILIGSYVARSVDYSKILSLCNILAKFSNSYIGVLTDGSNSSGASLSGFLPTRLPGGVPIKEINSICLNNIFLNSFKFYILFGLEVEKDMIFSKNVLNSLRDASFVLSFSSFKTDELLDYSTLVLPIASSYENSGTFVNISGVWQSFEAAVLSDYEVKLGWKALTDLANYFKLSGFVYDDSYSILSDLKSEINDNLVLIWNFFIYNDVKSLISDDLLVIPYLSQYDSDALVRRAVSLQKINDFDFEKFNFSISCNKFTHNKFIKSFGISNDFSSKFNFFINVDNNISDNILLIRNKNIYNTSGFNFLYDAFSFDKV